MERTDLIPIMEAADRLGMNNLTLRRWIKKGFVTAFEDPAGHIYLTEEQVANFIQPFRVKEVA